MKLLSLICVVCLLAMVSESSAFMTEEGFNGMQLQRQLMRGFNLVKPEKPVEGMDEDYYVDLEEPSMDQVAPEIQPKLQEPMENNRIGVKNRHGNPYRSMRREILKDMKRT